MVLGVGDPPLGLGEGLTSAFGGHDPSGAPILGITLTLDEAGVLQVVDDVRQNAAVDAQAGGQGTLRGHLLVHDDGQDVVAPTAVRQVPQ